jgi:hypothetical protein
MSIATSKSRGSHEQANHRFPYLRRNALLRRARSPDLLLRLSLQPFDRDHRNKGRYKSVDYDIQ